MGKALLENKVIVIIGGTTGMGFSAAKAFIAEGARVVGIGRSEESARAAQDELGASSARMLSADARDPGAAARAIETAVQEFGGFHGLFHVAGGSGRKWGDGPLHELTDEGWSETLDWNITTLFYSNRAAVRQFLKQGGGGSILNMGSVLGFHPSPKFFATQGYAATKAAAEGLVISAAAYYAPHKIRINLIAPSVIETPMAARAVSNPEIMEYIAKKQPLGGAGKPEDIDAAAVYFLSDGSSFVTGQILRIDGGWSVTSA